MTGFRILLRKELQEQVRSLRLVVTAIVFALLGIISPLGAKYLPDIIKALAGSQIPATLIPPPVVADAVDQLLKNVGQFGALAAVLLTMGAVATEAERGTAAFVLTKPASRGAFLAAKLAGIALNLLVATAAAGSLAWIYTTILFEPQPIGGYLAMGLLLWLGLVVFAALTLLGSVVAPSAIAAGALGMAGLIATGIVAILPTVGPYMPESLTVPGRALALGQTVEIAWAPLAANVGYVIAAAGLAWLLFRRREL